MRPWHLIILLLMNLFWAGVFSAYKVIGPDLATGGIVTLRFGLAALCFLVVWRWLPGTAPKGADLAKTCVMGLILYVLGQRLQVFGNHLGTAGNSAVLMAVEPLLTSLAAAVFLREHIGPRRWAGFVLGILGVALLNRAWSSEFRWTGLGASLVFIASFVCEAAYSVIGKPIVQKAGVMKMLAVSLAVGTAVNLLIDGPATFRAAEALPTQAWILLAVMAVVCTVIGYSVWFIVIRECPINVVALTLFSQSVFGVAIAVLWVGEPVHWGQVLGGLCIVSGLVYGLSRQIKPSVHPARGRSPASGGC
jgi:drug/metabolite transporter (DMT)-like permease